MRQVAVLLGLLVSLGSSFAASADEHWVSAWGSAQMVPDASNQLPEAAWRDASLRQFVRLSLSARQLRVRVSNVFGTAPLLVDGATVGLVKKIGEPDLQPGSSRPLRFNGADKVAVPPGAEYLSDPVDFDSPAGATLAISMHFLTEPGRQTSHPGARSNSFVVPGNQIATEQWKDAQAYERWYQLADVEVRAPRSVGALVAVGDSITDGYGVKVDTYTRWTDFLFERMQREKQPAMAIVNAGIGGGRVLREGLGPAIVARFERDVLGRSGVSHALVLAGVNDFGVQHRNGEDSEAARAQLLVDLQTAWKVLVERAHAQGICVIGGTVTPYVGNDYYHAGPDNEADRQALNRWIRTSGLFDAVADFDAALRDPAQPDRLGPQAESGDGLHPGVGGHKALAEAVPLEALRSCKWKAP